MAEKDRAANAHKQTHVRSQSAYSKHSQLRQAKDKTLAGKPKTRQGEPF